MTRHLPAATSFALAPLLQRGGTCRVLAVYPHAVYLRAHQQLFALVTSDAVAQPCAAIVAQPAGERPFAALRSGLCGQLVDGGVAVGELRVTVSRWWSPKVRDESPRSAVAARAVQLRNCLRQPSGVHRDACHLLDHQVLSRAPTIANSLVANDYEGAVELADQLIGRGSGLTPLGDDVLAGVAIGLHGFATEVQPEVLTRWCQHLRTRSAQATTTISAALLAHASRGEANLEALQVVRYLRGGHQPSTVLAALIKIGATSGLGLATGLLAAADASRCRTVAVRDGTTAVRDYASLLAGAEQGAG